MIQQHSIDALQVSNSQETGKKPLVYLICCMRSLTFFPLVLSNRRHHGNTNLMLVPNYTKLMATKHCSMSSAI